MNSISINNFKKPDYISDNWVNQQTWDFISNLSFDGYILAGHSVTNMIEKKPLQGDLDFWVLEDDKYISAFDEMSKYYKNYNMYPSMIELFDDDNILPRINLLYTLLTPEKLLYKFDFQYCKCMWFPSIDYNEIANKNTLLSINQKYISDNSLGYYEDILNKRIIKAVKYGYSFSNLFWYYFDNLILNPNKKQNIKPKIIKKYDIELEDLNILEFEEIEIDIIINDKNNLSLTLHEIISQYQKISLTTKTKLPILLKFTNDEILLLKKYIELIVFNNPLSEVQYLEIKIGCFNLSLTKTKDNRDYEYSDNSSKESLNNSDNESEESLNNSENEESLNNSESEESLNNSKSGVVKTKGIKKCKIDYDEYLKPFKNNVCKSSKDNSECDTSDEIGSACETSNDNDFNSDEIGSDEVRPDDIDVTFDMDDDFNLKIKKISFDKFHKRRQLKTVVKNIIPINNGYSNVVQLNESGSAYIIINYINEELKELSLNNFNDMWSLHPKEKHKIIMYEKEVEVHRYSKSYLNTLTDLSHTNKSSYMYSGFDTSSNNDELPELFKPYYEFIKNKDNNYNQVIANWYENEFDYISAHADCQKGMIEDSKISIISLYPNVELNNFRFLQIKPKPKLNVKSIADVFNIQLTHGCIITMCGTMQNEFTHEIEKLINPTSERISLSFRQMK